MSIFISLTRYAADRVLRVNAGAIAYLDACGAGTNIAFGSGETLRVVETSEQIEALVADARKQQLNAPRSAPPPAPAPPAPRHPSKGRGR